MTNTTNRAIFDRYYDINLVDRHGSPEAGIQVVQAEEMIIVWDNNNAFEGHISEYPAALANLRSLYADYLSEATDDAEAAVIAENLDTLDRAIADLAE